MSLHWDCRILKVKRFTVGHTGLINIDIDMSNVKNVARAIIFSSVLRHMSGNCRPGYL